MGTPAHATLDVGDVDGDGRPDIIVGDFAFGPAMDGIVDVWKERSKVGRVLRPSTRRRAEWPGSGAARALPRLPAIRNVAVLLSLPRPSETLTRSS